MQILEDSLLSESASKRIFDFALQAAAVARSDVTIFAGKAATLRNRFEVLNSPLAVGGPGLCSATLERWQGCCEAKGKPDLTVLGRFSTKFCHFEAAFVRSRVSACILEGTPKGD